MSDRRQQQRHQRGEGKERRVNEEGRAWFETAQLFSPSYQDLSIRDGVVFNNGIRAAIRTRPKGGASDLRTTAL